MRLGFNAYMDFNSSIVTQGALVKTKVPLSIEVEGRVATFLSKRMKTFQKSFEMYWNVLKHTNFMEKLEYS